MAALMILPWSPSAAQDATQVTSFNQYGVPGLIDTPTAEMAPDATLSFSASNMGDTNRYTLSFQIAPRLSGSFRYSAIHNFASPASVDGSYYDRSFDLRYQVLREGRYAPSVVVGLQDFIGTGLYGAEYIVATKTVSPGLKFTGGLGWGRLGSTDSFATTGNRPAELLGQGGLPTYDRWFRGPVSGFGGVSYSPNARWTFSAEYSTDAYAQETADGRFDRKSPWNFGFDYRLRRGAQLSAYYAYGNEVGIQYSMHTGLKTSPVPGGRETAPLPVSVRPRADIQDLGWTTDNVTQAQKKQSLAGLLESEGLQFEALKLEPRRATLRMKNGRFGATPQAIGRAARAMSRTMPASVEEFVIVPVVNGMAASGVVMRRSDIEALEHAPASAILERTQFRDGYQLAPRAEQGTYPQFTWSIAPYLSFSIFDPDNPVRADAGIAASATYRIAPNLVLSGTVTKKAGGNLDETTRPNNSKLPLVRTTRPRYSREGDPAISNLTLAYYGRPGPNLYSRVTAGYLESMYAGVSTELLWKPVDSRLALGAELNYVKPRDYNQLFGIRSSDTPNGRIPDVNGHISAYYDLGNDYHGQIDVGRYLAGDYGATISIDREFNNGWRVGAYATFTDVAFEDFGEGSFDKGIRISVPMGWALGQPSRNRNDVVIQSLTRDGGARLNVGGRLYEQVRDYHRPVMEKQWGRVWR